MRFNLRLAALGVSLLLVSPHLCAQVPGALDTTFGGNARVRTNFSNKVLTDASAADAIVQIKNGVGNANYGKIIVVGFSEDGTRPMYAMIRLNPNGTRDQGFGVNPDLTGTDSNNTDGVIKEFFGQWDAMTNAVIQPDEKIVTLGNIIKTAAQGGGEDWRMVRYNKNGDRDSTFGSGGVVTFNVPMTGACRTFDLAIDAQGRLLAAGMANDGNLQYGFIYRINSDGSFDSTFSNTGRAGEVKLDFSGSTADTIYGIAVQPSGRIVFAGRGAQPLVGALYGSDPDGAGPLTAASLDTTFGGNNTGYNLVPYGGTNDYFRGMTLDPSNRIVAMGRTSSNRNIVARFNANGTLDSTFSGGDGTNGFLIHDIGSLGFAEDVEVASDGSIIGGGAVDVVTNDRRIAAFKYTSAGAIDSSFAFREDGAGIPGIACVDAAPGFTGERGRGMTIQPDGNILVAGDGTVNVIVNGTNFPFEHMFVARFKPSDGSLDTTFNKNGQVLTSLVNKPGLFATRLTGGSADMSYDTFVQPDGKVVQVGQTWNGWDYDFAVTRVTTDGVLDTTFGDDDDQYADPARRTGKFSKDVGDITLPDSNDTAYAVAMQKVGGNAGKIVVAGLTAPGGVTLFRLNANGTFDTTFGASGWRTNDFSSGAGNRPRRIIVDAQDRIYLVGDISASGGSNLLLARYSANGSLDFYNTFNSNFFEEGQSLAFQPDGKVVIGGRGAAVNGGLWQMLVGRFNVNEAVPVTNGSFTIDNTFAMGRKYDAATGTIVTDTGYSGLFLVPHETRSTPTAANPNPQDGVAQTEGDEAYSVVVEADGTITLGGRTSPLRFKVSGVDKFPRPRFALARLTPTGWLDTRFGTNGWTSTYMDPAAEDLLHDSQIYTLLAQNDGKLVGVGTAGRTIDYDYGASRYNWDDGSIDTAFGTSGKSTVPVGAGHDWAYSGRIAPDGKIVSGGYDDVREDFTAVRWQGDSAPPSASNQSVAPNLTTDSSRANWSAGPTDDITNDNTPTFSGSPCTTGESVILRIARQSDDVEHVYRARALCRGGNTYNATVPSYTVSGGGTLGQLPDGTYKVAAYSATGGGSTALSPYLQNVVIDTVALVPTLTGPANNDIKDTEQSITFTGGGAELNAEVTVWDTTGVTWTGAGGTINTGTPTKICSGLANSSGVWTCSVNPLALSLGLHKIKVQQEDVASNKSAMCVAATQPSTTCPAEVGFYVKAHTNTTITSSRTPTVYGEPFTLTASVRANSGIPTPTGNVVLTWDTVAQTSKPLVSGDLTFTPAMPVSVGDHFLGAVFAENDKYYGSQTASDFKQVVIKADTSVTTTVNASPSVWGQSVTFTSVIAPVAPGAGTPTGTVTVAIDSGAAQNLTFSSLQALFTSSALTVGDHTLVFAYGGDGNFNGSSKTVNHTVNKAATTTAVTSTKSPSIFDDSVTLTATVSVTSPGAGSRTGNVVFKDGAATLATVALDGTFKAAYTTTAFTGGTHSITAEYAGDGNFFGSTSPIFTQTVNPKATTTSLTSSANPSVATDEVTFTATVNDARATGNVDFLDGTTVIGTVATTGGVAVFKTTALTPGTHPIKVVYAGDANFATSTSAIVSQVVNKIATTTAVTSSANDQPYGTSITLHATVTPAEATGTVTFRDGATPIGTVNVAGGVAELITTTLSAGAHSLTASYDGDGKYDVSTSTTLAQNVTQASTTTTLTTSGTPSVFGSPVTFTATLAPNTAGGTVQFFEGATPLGTSNLTGGIASLTTSALTAGNHDVQAVYAGDSNHLGSTSSTVGQLVDRFPTAVAVATSPNPSVYGGSVTLTATLSSGATGSVTFSDGATELGTANITSNTATLTTSSLTGGSHAITATYPGDANFLAGTSAPATHDVTRAAVTVTVVSSKNPSSYTDSVTFTATVTAGATGTVTFKDGATTLGSGSLSGTDATFTLATLTAGTHAITATYDGDTNYATGTSATLTQTVDAASTTTTLTGPATATTYGTPATFTATVTAGATGNVTFSDSGTDIATVALSGNTATFTTSTLAAGSHSIVATYVSDGNYLTSSSTAVPHTVDVASTTVTLASSLNPSTFTASVTFTATTAAGATGSISFLDGVTVLGSGTVSGGIATFSTSSLAVATHSITASYAGDANHSGSASGALAQVVDQAPTTITLASSANPSTYEDSVTFTATVTTGATRSVVFLDGTTVLATQPLAGNTATYATTALTGGSHAITARYDGDANYLGSTSAVVTQTVDRKATTTTLASSANPSTYGDSITLTATITNGATGTVTFLDGTTTLGSSTISGNTATLPIATLTGGSHSLTAEYAGDVNFASSTSPSLTQTVNKASTTTSLTSSANPSTYSDSVTFTATVTNGATGTVTFRDDVTTLGSIALSGNTATLSIATLAAGAHPVTATYDGDTNFATSSSSTVTQTVNKASTSVTIASSLNPSAFTDAVTFTATVPAGATGSVMFLDGATTLGSGAIGSGTATFTLSTLTAGGHSITASYAGDANYTGSTSSPLAQTVDKAPTTTGLVSSLNPSIFGDSVTFTATVTNGATGSITFTDGATLLGTTAITGNTASFTTASLIGGTHTITAAYSGDANWLSSNTQLTQTLTRAATTVGLASSANPSVYGGSVTLTATVTAGATGTVTFRDGATILGTGPVTGSTATFATAALTGGPHALSATYEGDVNFASSTSATLAQTVDKATTTTSLASSANPSVFGAAITFTATVTNGATGVVTFRDAATTLATIALAGNTAAFTTPALVAGPHSVTATYEGDGNFLSSSSAAITQTVDKAATTTSLASSPNPSRLNGAVTITATVTPGATGTVSFLDGATTLGTATLANGAASVTTSAFTPGTHSLTATYGGDANHLASASTVLTHRLYGPPTISATAQQRVAASRAFASSIATVGHEADPAGALHVTVVSVPAGITITDLRNDNGNVIATIAATCSASVGANAIVLQVEDLGGLTATANLNVDVAANPAPVLETYDFKVVPAFGSVSLTPHARPSDNGHIVSLAIARPATFTGTATITASTGVVQLTDVNPGAHTFKLTATDDCGATETRALLVRGNNPPVAHPATVASDGSPVAVTLQADDADGDVLTYAVVQAPAHGTLSGTAPSLVYTPASGFNGVDKFTFAASDALDQSAVATVTIAVSTSGATGPTVTRIDPSSGHPEGGTIVVIHGGQLATVTSVKFGGVDAEIIKITNDSIRVMTPEHEAGAVDVTVTTALGVVTAPHGFTFDANSRPNEVILPALGSTPGNFGAFFRTSIQLFNGSDGTFEGLLVFYQQGNTTGTPDKSMRISLAPGETLYLADVLPALGATGLGSGSLQIISGSMPLVLTRVYNDAGARGTAGMLVEAIGADEVLREGDTGVLIAPPSSDRFRFNIGVRTLDAGAVIEITLRDAAGAVRHVVQRTFGAQFFTQFAASDLLGHDWAPNDSVSIRVLSGDAVIYGASTDNKTQDPSLQQPRRLSLLTDAPSVFSVVGSTAGGFGSFFKTGMQFYNPTSATTSGRFVFHAQGRAGSDSDPAYSLTLKPGEVRSIDDFLPQLGLTGLGSVDFNLSAGTMPVSVVRIFNDAGDDGTTGMTIDPTPREAALQAGESSVLLTPPSSEGYRFNVGVRTLSAGATIVITHRDAKGNVLRTIEKRYDADFFEQTSASALIGAPVGNNESLTISIKSGAAIVYGSMTDNVTQDPTYQLAKPR